MENVKYSYPQPLYVVVMFFSLPFLGIFGSVRVDLDTSRGGVCGL